MAVLNRPRLGIRRRLGLRRRLGIDGTTPAAESPPDASPWTLKRPIAGLKFSAWRDGFVLDARATDDSAPHAVVVGTWDIDSDEAGDVVVSALCPPDDAARSGKPIYLSGTAEIRNGGTVLTTRKIRITVRPEPLTLVLPREEGGGNELRLTLSLNRRFKARVQVTGSEVAVQELDTASPLRDDYRQGFAWPGTTSMRWLADKSMYICAGCELTYLSDFLEKTGLRVHHTFQHNEGMDPVAQAANPDSELWRGRPDYMVLSPVQRFRSLLSAHEQRRATLDRAALEERLDEYIAELRDVLERLRQSGVACPIWLLSHVYTITPAAYGIHDYRIADGSMSTYELILAFKLRLYEVARQVSGVYVLDPDVAFEQIGKGLADRRLVRPYETLGGHPERTGARFLAEFLHHQMLVLARDTPRIKAVVLDSDNTLWKGVIREDGAAGIALHKTRMRRLWQLGLRGIPLALTSKNDPEDEELVMETLRSYGRMHEKIVATRLNWLPKSENIRSIAEQLNIGLDTIAFFDDSPFEREEVRTALPEVHVFPDTAITEAPDWYLFQPRGDLSVESLERVDKYREENARTEYQTSFSEDRSGFEAFLHKAQLRLELRPARAAEISRVADLLMRTNQMNATLKRLDATEALAFHERPDRSVHIVKLGDKFGDYGIIGTALTERRDNQLAIIELALSCRAMGRRVEDALLEEIIGYAADQDLEAITIDVTRTSRNQQIIETLERVGFAEAEPGAGREGTFTWRLDITSTGRRGRDFAPWFHWDDAIGDLE